MTRIRLYLMMIGLSLVTTGCAVGSVDAWFEEVYLKVVVYNALGLILNLVGQLTQLLAHTPIDLFTSQGFSYVYDRVAFAALVFVSVIWGVSGLRVFWGVGSPTDFHGVVARTAASLVIIKLIPALFLVFGSLANSLAGVFAEDYRTLDPKEVVSGSVQDIELGILLFSLVSVYYLVRILLQYAWRVGALILGHAFAPIFSVLWILPSQHRVLSQVARGILSLLVIQVTHTLEMWAYTWIVLGISVEGVSPWMRLLLQIGVLQVMVSTPGYITQHLSGWIEQPSRFVGDSVKLLSLSPIRSQLRRILGGRFIPKSS